MNQVFLLLGGNCGDRKRYLAEAAANVETEIGDLDARSSIYETAPWGNASQPDFLNQVIQATTALSAPEVLRKILAIENKMGRERQQKWEPRIIDIDLLFYNDEVIEQEGLQVPHPFLHERRFVLVPLVEIAPRLIHPVFHKSVKELLDICPDKLEVRRWGRGKMK